MFLINVIGDDSNGTGEKAMMDYFQRDNFTRHNVVLVMLLTSDLTKIRST